MPKSEFIVGVECECILFDHRIEEDALYDKVARIHPDIEVGNDGSIDCDDFVKFLTAKERERYQNDRSSNWAQDTNIGATTYELITPPLPAKESFRVFSRVLALIRRYGYTNKSCGCHVNISPVDKKDLNKINTLYLAYHPIFTEIAKAFQRSTNGYCLPNKVPDDIYKRSVYGDDGDDEGYIQGDKEAAINFAPYYYSDEPEDRRLEVRAFGNQGYEFRGPEIKRFTKQVFGAIRKSMKHHFDYMKK